MSNVVTEMYVDNILSAFVGSDCEIKPHFFVTGDSGAGKTYLIESMCRKHNLNFLKVNASALTVEGTSGNSVSKALSPLMNNNGNPTVVFLDEFDKLFVGSSEYAETKSGVQDELLTLLESRKASLFGNYGKYVQTDISNVLFVFAGVFRGATTMEDLMSLGIRTEFAGRVNLMYHLDPPTAEVLVKILEESKLLDLYLRLYEKNREDVLPELTTALLHQVEDNFIGVRIINTIIHKYFIEGITETINTRLEL